MNTTKTGENTVNKARRKELFIRILSLCMILAILSAFAVSADPDPETTPSPSSTTQTDGNQVTPSENADKVGAALLVDAETLSVMYEKNADEPMPTGVFSKLMTALISIEMLEGRYDDIVTIGIAVTGNVSGEHMELKRYEEIPVIDLIHGVVIFNAGDAALALALAISENTSEFAELMNNKALELGMKNSHFESPDGRVNDGGYITARDAAILARYAYSNETYRNICKKITYTVAPTNKHEETVLHTRNYFLSKLILPYYYMEEINGLCSAYTSDSLCCLAASAVISDKDYLCIILGGERKSNSEMYSFIVAKELFLWGGNLFETKTLLSDKSILGEIKVRFAREYDYVAVVPKGSLTMWLRKDEDITDYLEYKTKIYYDVMTAPIEEGQTVGEVEVYYKGELVGKEYLGTYRSLNADESEKKMFELLELVQGSTFITVAAILFTVLVIGVLVRARIKYLKDKKLN